MDKTFAKLSYEFETAFNQDGLLFVLKLSELVTNEYERQTGESCVNWFPEGEEHNIRTTLPRDEDFETDGYTDDFWLWLRKLEKEAYDNSAETVREIAMYIYGKFNRPSPPPFVWVATEETDEGEIPVWFFADENDARAWLRDLFVQHVKATMIPREHFIWENRDDLHQVYDGDTRWGLSVRKVRPAFNPVNP